MNFAFAVTDKCAHFAAPQHLQALIRLGKLSICLPGKHGLAGRAEVCPVLAHTGGYGRDIRDFADAELEGVGRAGGALLGAKSCAPTAPTDPSSGSPTRMAKLAGRTVPLHFLSVAVLLMIAASSRSS
jgi:hypothetical protein